MDIQRSAVFVSKAPPESNSQMASPEQELLGALTLARAALLARKGDLDRAEALLILMTDRADSRIEALDLLAKVYAQQGKIEQAQTTWLKALQQEPSNLHFLGALLLCAHHHSSRLRRFVSRPSGVRRFVFSLILIAAVATAILSCL